MLANLSFAFPVNPPLYLAPPSLRFHINASPSLARGLGSDSTLFCDRLTCPLFWTVGSMWIDLICLSLSRSVTVTVFLVCVCVMYVRVVSINQSENRELAGTLLAMLCGTLCSLG